jgi:hypothetical protein
MAQMKILKGPSETILNISTSEKTILILMN